jgi:hypothetical protein
VRWIRFVDIFRKADTMSRPMADTPHCRPPRAILALRTGRDTCLVSMHGGRHYGSAISPGPHPSFVEVFGEIAVCESGEVRAREDASEVIRRHVSQPLMSGWSVVALPALGRRAAWFLPAVWKIAFGSQTLWRLIGIGAAVARRLLPPYRAWRGGPRHG